VFLRDLRCRREGGGLAEFQMQLSEVKVQMCLYLSLYARTPPPPPPLHYEHKGLLHDQSSNFICTRAAAAAWTFTCIKTGRRGREKDKGK
jgi:hypothetical protein